MNEASVDDLYGHALLRPDLSKDSPNSYGGKNLPYIMKIVKYLFYG